MVEFQTITEFIDNPFGYADTDKRSKMEQKYQQMKSKSNLKVEGFTTIDDNYLIHVLIPSDSNPSQTYDVVVLFFTDENVIKKRTTFSNYYVKFFSNSPSFIYQYAYLYKQNGFLIDFLYDKLDSNYSETAPNKSNKDFELFYDKSIYCACRHLVDNQMILLSKLGIITKHKKSETAFFKDIKSFENIKMDSDLKNIDKKINKELVENKRYQKVKKKSPNKDPHRKTSKSNTLAKDSKPGIRRVSKKTGSKRSPTRSTKK